MRILIDDTFLEMFIKDLLSMNFGEEWTYRRFFQKLVLVSDVKDMAKVKKEVYSWLKGRI